MNAYKSVIMLFVASVKLSIATSAITLLYISSARSLGNSKSVILIVPLGLIILFCPI